MLLAALAGACTTAADVRASQEEAWQELQVEADRLFAALEQAAAEREIPIARSDPETRRITSEWVYAAEPERPEVRRRYHLSVIAHPMGGLALHARIVREAPTGDGESEPIFEAVERDEAVAAEEDAIVQRAYAIYTEGDGD